MLTRRAHLLAGLTLGVGLTLWLNPARAHTGENTPVQQVQIYEDGSGVQYLPDGTEVKTFPEGTFVWSCRDMGNRICGPTYAD